MNKNRSALKNTLVGNAAFSVISGSLLVLFSQKIAQWFGLENNTWFWVIGVGVLFFGGFVWWVAQSMRRNWVYAVILQDALWVVVSIAVLVLRPFGISAAGNVWIALVAAIVAYFGIKQWQGVRKV